MFLSKNLKYLRKSQTKFSQTKFAEAISALSSDIDVTRSAYSSYEEGRAEPKLELINIIANYFSISIDELLNQDLENTQELRARRKEDLQDYAKGNRQRVLAITVDNDNQENIELVPEKAAAGYTKGYEDVQYISELPKYRLPFLAREKTYRAFEISGDSMLPLTSKTIIIGEYVENWNEVKEGQVCIVVSRTAGVVLKRVHSRVVERQTLLLKSFNINYRPYEIPIDEVLEIWKFAAYISRDLPQPQVQAEDLKESYEYLQNELHELKANYMRTR
ncbi:MAG: helix-turn-helix domain-containing protein [Bernardetiaceae bacterium]|nr:helix-turn-helix domain-containing protein [Bernardetiaceae bacterium]